MKTKDILTRGKPIRLTLKSAKRVLRRMQSQDGDGIMIETTLGNRRKSDSEESTESMRKEKKKNKKAKITGSTTTATHFHTNTTPQRMDVDEQNVTETEKTQSLTKTITNTMNSLAEAQTQSKPSRIMHAPTDNIYNNEDKGPIFGVILEKENINEMAIGKLLQSLNIKTIVDIVKVGRNRVKVNVKDKNEANKILTNLTITKIKLIKTFIPNNFVKTTGIVFNVPEDLTDEELICNSSTPGKTPIEKIERILYWDKEKKEHKKSKNVRIVFRSTKLPETMFMFHVHRKVVPYIPRPTLCRKCLRYGHVASICRSSSQKCFNCAGETHNFDANCTCEHCTKKCVHFCAHCMTNTHNTFDKNCMEQKKQQEIKKQMTLNNATFVEAKNIVEKQNNAPTVSQSFASVVQLTSQIQKITEELENLRKVNALLIERVSSAEHIISVYRTGGLATAINSDVVALQPNKETTFSSPSNSTTINLKEKNKMSNTTTTIDAIASNSATDRILNAIQTHEDKFKKNLNN